MAYDFEADAIFLAVVSVTVVKKSGGLGMAALLNEAQGGVGGVLDMHVLDFCVLLSDGVGLLGIRVGGWGGATRRSGGWVVCLWRWGDGIWVLCWWGCLLRGDLKNCILPVFETGREVLAWNGLGGVREKRSRRFWKGMFWKDVRVFTAWRGRVIQGSFGRFGSGKVFGYRGFRDGVQRWTLRVLR
ncbi:hypothetical protein TRIP_B200580 [uncultured Desulfatiglans sp.]|uniref:Uncharacterized protein n=1 Tax=Uncultured Desulfatiglans sp. TaxID=1748965 RepID=A0A653A347_UNCDX|nr:hypothetical protein TRIP_B200580 [uncultured Desulfatiglans sp.]